MGSLKLYHRRPPPRSYADRGPRRETQGQGVVGPPPPWRRFPDWFATPARRRSWRRRNPLRVPMLMLVGPSQEGGGLCHPVNAPAQVSQQGRGVSDPASASQSPPRGHSAESLTPHVSASGMCWGARVVRNECCPRMRTRLTSN
jgi:hypothetical protein